jgi:UPF0271 protein
MGYIGQERPLLDEMSEESGPGKGQPPQPRRIVCDTSVLLAGGDPRGTPDDEIFVTPSVLDEVKRPDDRERLETLREIGLRIQSPTAASLQVIEQAALATGDGSRLSKPDKELLALAADLKGELLTDDRSMQNVAATLKIPYRGFSQSEIKGVWHWQSVFRCVGCGRTYENEPPKGECIVCGHQVRKKHWRVPMGEAAGPKRRQARE